MGALVQWIHPSYRDLVIEEVAADKNLRHRFLQLMDIEGVKLAVSQAGGGHGERRMPLLTSAEDWAHFAKRCDELIKAAPLSEDAVLVEVLRSATLDLRGEERKRLLNTLAGCCDALRAKWDAAAKPIKETSLRELFEATLLIDPLPASPRLGPTWKAATRAFQRDVADAKGGPTRLDADAILEWVDLAELLTKNEPRYMRQVTFPKAFVGDVTQLLIIAKEETGLNIDEDQVDDLWWEAQRMNNLAKSLELLQGLFRDLQDQIDEVLGLVSTREDYLKTHYREATAQEEPDYDPDFPRAAGSPAFDPEALFSDL